MRFRLSFLFAFALALTGCELDAIIGELDDGPGESPLDHAVLGPLAGPCGDDGWCWVRRETPGLPIVALDGSGPDNIWAVDQGSHVYRYDGAGWEVRSLEGMNLSDVAVLSEREVWLIGGDRETNERKSLRFDGATLESVTVAGETPRQVFGGGPHDLYAAGPDVCQHFDGEGWSACAAPFENGLGHTVCERPDDVSWSICEPGTAVTPQATTVGFGEGDNVWLGLGGVQLWHFDGAAWSQVWPPANAPEGSRAPLVGAVAPDGAAFFYCETGDAPRYTARFSDGEWTFWQTPFYVRDIAALDHDRAIAASAEGIFSLQDGAWSNVDAFHPNAVFHDGERTWAAGPGGTILKRELGNWQVSQGDRNFWPLLDVATTPNGDLWAVGFRKQVMHMSGADGSWTDVDIGASGDLFGVEVNDDGEVLVHNSSQLFRFDGDTWSTENTPTSGGLVWLGDGVTIVGGCEGLLEIDANGVATPIEFPDDVGPGPDTFCSSRAWDIEGPSRDDLWLLVEPMSTEENAPFREVLHFDGVEWQRLPDPDLYLQNIEYDGERVWAVGFGGDLKRFDGQTWVDMQAPDPLLPSAGSWSMVGGPYQLRAFAPDDIYRFGQVGSVAHFDGVAWEDLSASRSTAGLLGIAGIAVSGESLYAVGMEGMVLRRER